MSANNLFVLRFNIPVNQVMLGQSYRFLGITSSFRELSVVHPQLEILQRIDKNYSSGITKYLNKLVHLLYINVVTIVAALVSCASV